MSAPSREPGAGAAAPDNATTGTTAATPADFARRRRRGRIVLVLLALVTITPVAASYALYYFWPRDKQVNYGELLPTRPLPPLAGTKLDGTAQALGAYRGRWVLVTQGGGACDAACDKALYASRQARTIQGREMDRVVRVWLVSDDVPPAPARLAEHPGLEVLRVPPEALGALPAGRERIYLVDPLGNQVLAWPADPDIKRMAKDLERLLKASQIG